VFGEPRADILRLCFREAEREQLPCEWLRGPRGAVGICPQGNAGLPGCDQHWLLLLRKVFLRGKLLVGTFPFHKVLVRKRYSLVLLLN